MADCTLSKPLQQVPRFHGTNWKSWLFSAKAELLFLNALSITDGSETEPPATAAAATIEDYKKRAHQGLFLILVSVNMTIHQLLDIRKSSKENWNV